MDAILDLGVDKEQGVLDVNVYDMKDLDLPFPDKNDRLRYGITCLNHAMVVEGVRMADNEKNFQLVGEKFIWRVERSSGISGHARSVARSVCFMRL